MSSELLPLSKAKEIIKEHLATVDEKINDFVITYAKLDQTKLVYSDEIWRINIEFQEEGKAYVTTALFSVDARTGSIVEYKRGSYWTF